MAAKKSAPKATKVKKVGLFGAFSSLFTTTVPKAGSVIERSLNIVDLGLSAAEKQIAVIDMESEIDLIDAAGDHAEALVSRNVTMDQLNAIKLARGIK